MSSYVIESQLNSYIFSPFYQKTKLKCGKLKVIFRTLSLTRKTHICAQSKFDLLASVQVFDSLPSAYELFQFYWANVLLDSNWANSFQQWESPWNNVESRREDWWVKPPPPLYLIFITAWQHAVKCSLFKNIIHKIKQFSLRYPTWLKAAWSWRGWSSGGVVGWFDRQEIMC